MDTVKCIGNEFYSRSGRGGVLFPALKELTLFHMNGLEEWMVAGGDSDRVFPCLEKLSIQRCRMLKSILICGLSSLVEFEIAGCGELGYLSGEFDGFTSLRLLRIQNVEADIHSKRTNCTSLKLIIDIVNWELFQADYNVAISRRIEIWIGELIHINDLQELSSLQRLCIRGCHKLINIDWHGLQQLRSLVELQIYACWSLNDFPEEDCTGSLTQLKELRIGGFSGELEAFPGGLLKSINFNGSLLIYGWDKLKSVPHQLQHLTALKTLSIYKFKGDEFEEALPEWLANLSSLQHLRILDCKNLKYLPSSTAIQRLSKLEQLIINGCPLLEENCREDNGLLKEELVKENKVISIAAEGIRFAWGLEGQLQRLKIP
uniref:R13L1/DRL21-like LRR repeat region domain-containing protein n=1 Tax=Salix viminalis TaxID=40686 RepID=A0A6N2K1L9_SALVM